MACIFRTFLPFCLVHEWHTSLLKFKILKTGWSSIIIAMFLVQIKGVFWPLMCLWNWMFLHSHLAEVLISWPFFNHLTSALGSATSTDRTIFFPLLTEYADSNRLRNAAETSHTWSHTHKQKHRDLIFHLSLVHVPSLALGSTTFIFLSRFNIPRRSVMPYWNAIFSYSLGWAFFRISQTSVSNSGSGFFFLWKRRDQ